METVFRSCGGVYRRWSLGWRFYPATFSRIGRTLDYVKLCSLGFDGKREARAVGIETDNGQKTTSRAVGYWVMFRHVAIVSGGEVGVSPTPARTVCAIGRCVADAVRNIAQKLPCWTLQLATLRGAGSRSDRCLVLLYSSAVGVLFTPWLSYRIDE